MFKKLFSFMGKPSFINSICIALAILMTVFLAVYLIEVHEKWNTIHYDTSNVNINNEQDVIDYMNEINSESPLYLHKFASQKKQRYIEYV